MLVGLIYILLAGVADNQWQRLLNERIAFDARGEPVVTVGLSSEVEIVELSCKAGCRLAAEDGSLAIPKNTPFTLRAQGVTLGETMPVAYVEAFPYGVAKLVTEARTRWESRGYATGTQDVGMIFGMGGRVFDNRRTQLFVELPSLRDLAPAERTVAEQSALEALRAESEGQPWISRRVLHSATGMIATAIGKKRWQTAAGAVKIEGGVITAKVRGGERNYRASLLVALLPSGRLALAARLPLEALLKGIVPKEIPASAPLEALKAQAVTARGEALAKLAARHLDEPFTLCSEVHCQVYGGDDARTPMTDAAVDATRGEVMIRDGQVVDAVYSANCGGATEDNEVVWPGPAQPLLRGRFDDATGEAHLLGDDARLTRFLTEPSGSYCESASLAINSPYRWNVTLTWADLTARLKTLKDIGDVSALAVSKRGLNGRVHTLTATGSKGTLSIERELPIRRALGLKSGLFVIKASESGVTLQGGGFGHGVGMCQVGAIGRAEAGHSYRQILKHYYGGTAGGMQIQSLTQP